MPYMSFLPHWLLSEFETSLQIVVPVCSSFDSPVWGLITIFRLLALWFFVSSWSCLPLSETTATLTGVSIWGVMSSSTFARLCCSKKNKNKTSTFYCKKRSFFPSCYMLAVALFRALLFWEQSLKEKLLYGTCRSQGRGKRKVAEPKDGLEPLLRGITSFSAYIPLAKASGNAKSHANGTEVTIVPQRKTWYKRAWIF